MLLIYRTMKWVSILLIYAFFCPGVILSATEETAPGRKMAQQATKAKELWITADHSKHQALQQEFKSGAGSHQSLSVLPFRGRRPVPQDHPLDLDGSRYDREQGPRQRRSVHQQFLSEHPKQRGSLHIMSRWLWVEGQRFRLYGPNQGRLSGLP